MFLWQMGVYVVLLGLPHISKAFVDTYKDKYQISIDTLDKIRQSGDSYYNEKMQVLDSYTGLKAQQCKDELGNEAIITVQLQTIMIGVTGQVHTIDKEISTSVDNCDGNGLCISKAMCGGESKLNALKAQVIPQILSIKNNGLNNIIDFMDNCVSKQS